MSSEPMTRGDPEVAAPSSIERWPTGAKVFLILSVALLPLAVIAIFATLQTTRTFNDEARARLRLAAAESSRSLAIELGGDVTALKAAVAALGRDPADAPSCARVQGVFAQQLATGTRFAIVGPGDRILCGSQFPGWRSEGATGGAIERADVLPGAGLLMTTATVDGVRGVTLFPEAFLSRLSRPSGLNAPYAATLSDGEDEIELAEIDHGRALERRETIRTGLGIDGLVLEMQIRSTPISSPMIIAMLLPLVMWALAASIAWFVVDRLLIRPLRALNGSVAAFRPGTEIDPASTRRLPAQEIRELGETFQAISRTVVLHEAGLADGLVRQTKLTREVHHRVKNNLQVIASLISLHARGAKSAEATQAYATIQRRVDALAVVHRNHFAEMEENRGLSLRSMVGELAANLRATAADNPSLGIVVDVEPLSVNQDIAVAVAFLITEAVELAMSGDAGAKIRISVNRGEPGRATLRISSPALIEGDALRDGLSSRYGRVLEGLSRQLRAKLHHDPLVGAFEISIAVVSDD
jgi:two-component system, sensor histidine kinase PdtaS